MRRILFVVVVAGGVFGVTSCGDNSRQCGPGTTDVDGVCRPDDDGSICGDGTILDESTGDCVVDPSVCGNGTVLINGQCQDPTAGLDIDLLEAAEPNGFEADATPAGVITLESVGSDGFTIHGCVKPLGNNAPDLDRYLLSVNGPTLIKITADGVQGLAAGFIAFGDPTNPLLATWQRLGINLATDTSKREVFLPAAGQYDIVITDSRTLFPITQGNNTLVAAGDPEGTTCYYVTIDARTINLQPFDLATGDSGTIGEDLKFYAGTFPLGFTSLVAVIDPEDIDGDGDIDIDSRAASSLVVVNEGGSQVNDANAFSPFSSALFGSSPSGTQPLVVLDYVWNMTIQPADYEVVVEAALDSQALSTTGGTVNATSNGQFFLNNGVADFDNINLFHFDVAGDDEIDGVNLTASIQLQGVVADQNAFTVAQMTGLVGNATSSTTFGAYRGLLRTAAPGRYYLVVFAPRNPVGTAFTIQSTITPQVLEPVVLDTPITQTVNVFNSNALAYDAGVEPWQLFNATGVNTGVLSVELYDVAGTFGRLDNLSIRSGGGVGVASTLPNNCPGTCDVSGTDLQHDFNFLGNGSNPAGRILRNPLALVPPAITNMFVKVNPTVAAGVRSFTLDFETRIYDDFGGPAIDTGTTQTLVNQTISAVNPELRYYFETAPNNLVTITATPTGTPPTLNVELALIGITEADTRVIDMSALTAPETVLFAAGPGGFQGFKVRGGIAPSIGNFTLAVKVDPPFNYTVTDGTTVFADACVGGTAVTLIDDGSGFGGTDEGLSAAAGIAMPAGFLFFGATASRFRVSSNGFFTFNIAGITSALSSNDTIPNAQGIVNIAPFWDDLGNIAVCTKTVAGKLVVQWTGDDFFEAVQFQAILDPADESIEFVWGPNHEANGAFATVGIQGALGSKQLGFNQAIVSAGTSKKLTP